MTSTEYEYEYSCIKLIDILDNFAVKTNINIYP